MSDTSDYIKCIELNDVLHLVGVKRWTCLEGCQKRKDYSFALAQKSETPLFN